MDWTGFGEGVSAAGSLVSGLSDLFGGARRKQQRAYQYQSELQKENAKLQYEYGQMAADAEQRRAKENFDYEAAYNDPAQVRARLDAAGMLGASMFEGAAPVTPSMSGSGTPSVGASIPAPVGVTDPAQSVGEGLSDAGMKLAQLDLLRSETNLNNKKAGDSEAHMNFLSAQTDLTKSQTLTEKQRKEGLQLDNDLKAACMANNIQQVAVNLASAQEKFKVLVSEAAHADEFQEAAIGQMQSNMFAAIMHGLELNSQINLNSQNQKYLAELTQSLAYDNAKQFMVVSVWQSAPEMVKDAVLSELASVGFDVSLKKLEEQYNTWRNQFLDPNNPETSDAARERAFTGSSEVRDFSGIYAAGLTALALMGGPFAKGIAGKVLKPTMRKIGF